MTPETETDLCDIIRSATDPLVITGGGTRGITSALSGVPLSTSALSGIEIYEPGALTLVAKTGTPVAEIEAALSAENQMLAFEPMDHRALLGTTGTPTIGGVVAANVSGPRRMQSGACRDALLGVRFVDGTGTLVKNGGRVMKNVTGYDLSKLFCGAMGTLGVLTQVALKVLPKPEAMATLTLHNVPPDQAVAAMSAAMATPYDVTGATYGPCQDAAKLHLRIEGMAGSVAYRAQQLKTVMLPFGEAEIVDDPETCRALWAALRDVTHLADMLFVARSSITPSDATGFIDDIGQSLTNTNHLDWAGGLIWTGAGDADAHSLHTALQAAMSQRDGHTTLVKSNVAIRAAVPTFQPQHPTIADLSRQLRNRFDPRGILNAGLMQ